MSSLLWNGTDRGGKSVGSGVYLVRLSTDRQDMYQKMLLLK